MQQTAPDGGQPGAVDNPDELFDLVTLDDTVCGVVRRGEAHANPALVHRSVQVLVFTSDGRVLWQRRSARKDLFPGFYCASASGHLARGEAYDAAAAREVAEELGVHLRLAPVGKALVRSAMETEMTSMFVACGDGPFQLHPTETDGAQYCTLDEAVERSTTGALPLTPAALAVLAEVRDLQQNGQLAPVLATLRQTAPARDGAVGE